MLELKNVGAGYDGTEIVHGVNARFEAGESYVLLGQNGCGKTTLLRAMSQLIPHSGDILLDGTPIETMKRCDLAEKIAIMSQINELYFAYSVFDTVMLGRYPHMKKRHATHSSREDRDCVERVLRSSGLWDMRDRSIDTLSGGQRQRVFLAHTLAQDPSIILLDEPTNHLDVKHQVELIDYLKHWICDGKHMVIGVFHDINLALRLSQNVLFMREGIIERQGRFTDIADRAFLTRIYGMDIAQYVRDSMAPWQHL